MPFIFLYGRPGSGKTTLAASMTNLDYRVLFLDADCKVDKMVNLQHLLKEGKIKTIPIQSKLMEGSLRQRILTPKIAILKQPQGYLEFCDIITGFEEMATKGEKHECQVLVIDSLTTIQEHMKRLIWHVQGKSHFTYDEWIIMLSNLEEMFQTLQRLQMVFKHVIVIAHEMTERDETLGTVETLPFIEGQMRHKVGKSFEEVYYCRVDVTKMGQVSYKVLTCASERYTARTSRKLGTNETADFEVLFKDELPEDKKKKLDKLELLKQLKTKKGGEENG